MDSEPIRQQSYRVPVARKEVVKEIDKMVDMGAIQPSTIHGPLSLCWWIKRMVMCAFVWTTGN